MAKKQTRNQFRDMIGDYYKTNREISKNDRSRYQAAKQRAAKHEWTRSEKMMLFTTIFAGVLLLIKLFVLGI